MNIGEPNHPFVGTGLPAGSGSPSHKDPNGQLAENISPLKPVIETHFTVQIHPNPSHVSAIQGVVGAILPQSGQSSELDAAHTEVSAPEIGILGAEVGVSESDKREVEKRSGAIWECTGREGNDADGYIYTFKLKAEFVGKPELVQQENDRLFLAVEPFHQFAEEFEEWIEDYPILTELGYAVEVKSDNTYLKFPDEVALKKRWDEQRGENGSNRPHLAPLNISSSEGIAEHVAFIETFLTFDGLLSNGTEFIHDQATHLLPTLRLMIDSESVMKQSPNRMEPFAVRTNKMRENIRCVLQLIKNGEEILKNNEISDDQKKLLENSVLLLKVLLGVHIDILTSRNNYQDVEKNLKPHIMDIFNSMLKNERLNSFLKKEFKKADVDDAHFNTFINETDVMLLFVILKDPNRDLKTFFKVWDAFNPASI